MSDDPANVNEGADPSSDIAKQNPDEETTGTMTEGDDEDRAGIGEGADADENGEAKDEDEQPGRPTKTQDLAKAGRDGFDPDAGQE